MIGRDVCRRLIKDKVIYNINEYPRYNDLEEKTTVIIESIYGRYAFKIKQDVYHERSKESDGSRNSIYTVELFPIEETEGKRDEFKDKLIMMVMPRRFKLSLNSFVYGLIDEYLETI